MYESRPGVKLYYYYDSYSNLSAIRYVLPDGVNGTEGTNEIYYVTTNAQGDVLGIYTSQGVQVAAYEYDAWGNCTVYDVTQDSAGNNVFTEVTYSDSQKFNMEFLNPFRYRGYYYDQDMGLYYLQSRYYDPQVGRFINADSESLVVSTPLALINKNLFAYCDNNPIVRRDTCGEYWETILDLASLGLSIYDVCKHPDDIWSWVGLGADLITLAVPVLSSGGAAVKAVTKSDNLIDATKGITKSIGKTDNATNVVKATNKIHGNSLKTTKLTYGYALKYNDTGKIAKFGETTIGPQRYTKKFYADNNVYMDILISGTKYDMHNWQHNQIIQYNNTFGHKPPLNKSFW